MNTLYRWTFPAFAALFLVFLWTLSPAASPAAPDGITPLETLRSAAEKALQARAQALGHPVNISINELDPRLRVALCSQPLDSAIARLLAPAPMTTEVVVGAFPATVAVTVYVPAVEVSREQYRSPTDK